MATLNRYAVIAILGHLDAALAETRQSDRSTLECRASWNLHMARERLLESAITDIDVEQVEAA
jgi:hypothetical protein